MTWARTTGRRTVLAAVGLTVVVWASTLAAHPFYVTISQVDYNAETRAFEITVKFFTDDLERALEHQGGAPVFLGGDREVEDADERLFAYVASHVELAIDGRRADLRYVGRETEVDATWCYVEITGVDSPSRLTITNRLLLDHFDTQTNIVHVKVGGVVKSLLLRDGHESEELRF